MDNDYAKKLLGSALDDKQEKDTYSYYIEKQWGDKLKALCDKKDARAASKVVNQLIKDFVLAVEAAEAKTPAQPEKASDDLSGTPEDPESLRLKS